MIYATPHSASLVLTVFEKARRLRELATSVAITEEGARIQWVKP